MADEVFDVNILGAGPAGLFGAFYAGLRGLSVKVIEALPEPGGQLAVLYPEKYIYDVPGHPHILAQDLVKLLLEQCELFAPTYVFQQRISSLARVQHNGEEVWELGSDSARHRSRTLLITAGVGAFAPNRIDVPGVERFEGRGVYYFVRDKRPFRNKRVLIVGGGDTAVDWCLNLRDTAQSITLIHRRDKFRAHESSLKALHESDIPIRTFWELREVRGDDHVTSAVIFNNKSDEEDEIEVDSVLVNIGFKPSLGPIADWGLELADSRRIRVRGMMETNLPGVFAAGDIAAVEGIEPLGLIVTGFGQAAIAANAAKHFIDPDSKVFPGHSSDMKL